MSEPSGRVWVLREFHLFQDLHESEVAAIGEAAPMRRLLAGQLIYSPGQPAEVLFILKAGRIRLFQVGQDGRTVTLGFVVPGEIFGEMSMLGQHLEHTFAEADEDCLVCVMGRRDVERLLLADSRIATRVAEHLGRRVAELERRLGESVLLSAPDRIVATVLRMSAGGRAIRVTHEQLAELVGSTRETTTKVLGELSDRGLVALRRGRIVVLDQDSLAALAGSGLQVRTGGRPGIG
ncbi:MAG: Crp/Fnr family transcriptional regulator [Actinomycetales bacterium]